MAEQPKKIDPFTEISNVGLYRKTGFVQREFLPNLRHTRSSEVWREMSENDAIVAAVLFQIDMLLRRVEWHVEPCGSGDGGEITDEDVERADFLTTCMDDLSGSWEEFISDALTMLPYGFSLVELVYKRRESSEPSAQAETRTRYPDGKIGWRKFAFVPQETIADWHLDDTGGVQAAVQRTQGNEIVIPVEKLLLFRTTKRTPVGRSILRTAYRDWYFKKRIEEVEGIAIERDLTGLPVMYAQPDYLQKWKTDLQKIVQNVRNDEQMGVLLPDLRDEQGNRVLELSLMASPGQKQINTDVIVARHNRAIAQSVMQDVLLLGHEKVGTQALAQEKRDLSAGALQAWLNLLAAIINDHAVPRLFALNGESLEHLPVITPGELQPLEVQEFATAMRELAAAGFVYAEDPEVDAFVRRRIGLPAMPEEVHQRMTEDQLEEPEEPVVPPMPGQPTEDDDAVEPDQG